MAGFRDSSGGGSSSLGSGLGAAVGSISNAVKKSAPRKPSAPRAVYNQARSSVNNIGRSVARSSNGNGNSNRRSSYSAPSSNSYRPAQPPRVVAPRPPVGNTPSGTIAKSVPPPPPPISIDDYLAKDTAYNSQKSAYQKALADYATQMKGEQSKYTGEYDAQNKQLGLDRVEGQTNLSDDYASRGLINSGVYGDALGDLNKKYDTQAADLQRAKQAYMDDLTTGQTNFQGTQQTLLEKARQDALNRRLDSLKV